jgi:hypothetical protein
MARSLKVWTKPVTRGEATAPLSSPFRRAVALSVLSLAIYASSAAHARPPVDAAQDAAARAIKSQLESASDMAADQIEQNLLDAMGSVPGGADLLNSAFDVALSAANLGIPGISVIAGPLMDSLLGGGPNPVEQKLAELDSRVAGLGACRT